MSLHTAFWTTLSNAGFISTSTNPNQFTFDEERASSALGKLAPWSPEAEALKSLMVHERKNGKTRSAASIYGFILTLLLDGKGISDCDATLLQFRQLTELHLSNNKLSALKNLPPTLQILHAYGNRIKDIDFGQCRALVHAGFGFNALAGAHLPMFKPLRSSLVSLDLSCNEFCQIDELTKALAKFPHLRHLYLMGNPMCMLRSYRRSFVAKLPKLLLLDGIEIKEEERLAASLASSSSASASSIDAEAPAAAVDAAAAASGESALASTAAAAPTAAPSELVTMSVRLDSLFGVTIEEDAVTERSLYKVLAALPDLKDKAADAQAAIAAAVAAAASSGDAVAPVAPMVKLRKTTSYHVVFRLADDAVYRSVDFDLAAVKAASEAAAAAAATSAPAAKGAKAAPAPAAAAAAGGSIEPVELPLNIEADVAFPPSVRWRNFLSLNLLDIFLIRRETTTPVVETEEEAAAAKAAAAAAAATAAAAAPAAKKDAKAAPAAAAAPEVAEPASLPPAWALLPGNTRELSAEQLSALTKVADKVVGVAHVDTAKFLDARRSELTVALAKRVAFYAERPAPDLNPQYERRVPADVAAPDQPPPKRTRTEAGVRVRLRFNMSAEEAQDGRDEEGDAS